MYKKDLNTPIQYVKGVGPKLAALLHKKDIDNIEDALYFLPRTYEDRSKMRTIAEIEPMEYCLFKAQIIDIDLIKIRFNKKILVITVGDKTGKVSCKWFNFNEKYMIGAFKAGDNVIVSGNPSIYAGRLEIHHPDIEKVDNDDDFFEHKLHYGRIVPVYSETQGLSQKIIRRIQYNIVENHLNTIEDVIPLDMQQRLTLPELKESLKEVHFPSQNNDVEKLRDFKTPWQKRLIFDEFFILEIALALRRRGIKKRKGISFNIKTEWLEDVFKEIPFDLTNAQKRVLTEILEDMKKPEPMNRLVQGDVGSGKTIVGFISALVAITNGYQASMMVPTEILAEQHYNNFKKLFGDKYSCACLVSSMKKKEKEAVKEALLSGEIKIVFGTHALIQEGVGFDKLGLVIVDEQHRFGVEQRLELISKGMPDTIVMTATPIPRTLAMTVYGDLDISIIDEKPKGRIPIITKLVYENKRKTVYDFIRDEIAKGRQIYFVYPLVEESEKLMLKDAKEAARKLADEFKPYNVALLHGRMRGEEKEAVMKEFKEKKAQILVSTTVIEVGIDVPNASVMVIEHPERFGLSQLHQLRGRIGRGDVRSCCVLLASTRLSEQAYRRLNTMVMSDDGFKIAEEDLAIRGPGEFLGTRQHGLPGFRVGNLLRDMDTLILARNEALRLIKEDPYLSFPCNQSIRYALNSKFKGKIEMMDAG